MTKRPLAVALAASLLTCAACSGQQATTRASKSNAVGSITASPNPIKICDGSSLGVTNLSWTANGGALFEVHVKAPNGDLLSQSGAQGTAKTGNWVTDGLTFYLQDVSDSHPLTSDYTVATVTVKHTAEGCPPNPAASATPTQ
jgi:hypothetical protein